MIHRRPLWQRIIYTAIIAIIGLGMVVLTFLR